MIRKRANRFIVQIEGRNVLILDSVGNRLCRVGFFATRSVEAELPNEAADLALEIVRRQLIAEKIALNGESDPPELSVEWVRPLQGRPNQGWKRGFTFYPEAKH